MLLANAGSSEAQSWVRRFVDGDEEMGNHDNLDDGSTGGDVRACLPDGMDRDRKTDGCVRMLSITDMDAEPSGFIFDGTGKMAFYHAQHGRQVEGLYDWTSNMLDGKTDDLIMITGFKREDHDDADKHDDQSLKTTGPSWRPPASTGGLFFLLSGAVLDYACSDPCLVR